MRGDGTRVNPPVGERAALTVDIGGLPIRLHCADRGYLDELERRFSGFTHDSSDSQETLLDVTLDLVVPGDVDPDDDVRVRKHGRHWTIERSDCSATFDLAARSGHIRQPGSPYATDSVLRILHTLLLAERGGALMHAASALRNGRAHVFFGPSGAGKSTIVGLAPDDATLLSDEVSYLKRDREAYLACGTPFTGELERVGANVSAPLAGLYRLVQGAGHRLEPMAPADGARALLESVLCFAIDPVVVTHVFETACDLVTRVPVQTLVFERDASVWDLIE
jgi:hypothetical protein